MPIEFEREARSLAHDLDRSRGEDVARRLSYDSQYMDRQTYSALLRRVSQYDQKGVGDDLIIIDRPDGSQKALIRPSMTEVGTVIPAPPPPGYYQSQGPYRGPGYYDRPAPPPPTVDCTITGAVAGGVLGSLLTNRANRPLGTISGAIAGAVVGNEACKR